MPPARPDEARNVYPLHRVPVDYVAPRYVKPIAPEQIARILGEPDEVYRTPEPTMTDELKAMLEDVRWSPETHAIAFVAGSLFTVAAAFVIGLFL